MSTLKKFARLLALVLALLLTIQSAAQDNPQFTFEPLDECFINLP